MLRHALGACAALFSLSAFASDQGQDLTSWSLRFSEKVSRAEALTGCYGTASYSYVLPSVETVKAYRLGLKEKAGELEGFAFTRDESQDHESALVVDLATGEVRTIPYVSDDEGIAFCVCRASYTQARHTDGRPNCSYAPALPPLGMTFLASPDATGGNGDGNGDGEQPQPIEQWTDSATGWVWSYMAPAATWREAKAMCGENMPRMNVLSHAARRIWSSTLGTRIRAADADKVWSADEFDWRSAMFVWIPDGDAASGAKDTLLPVLCVDKTP